MRKRRRCRRLRIPTARSKGKPDRVRFRFDNTYMQMAAQGKL